MNSSQVKMINDNKDTPFYETMRNQIKKKLQEKNFSISAFEREAGLTKRALNNVLNVTPNPSAEVLYKIAEKLDCSIDELLGREKFVKQSNPISSVQTLQLQKLTWNKDVFQGIVKEFNEELDSSKKRISADKAIYIIQEVYIYLLKTEQKETARSLIGWLLDKAV